MSKFDDSQCVGKMPMVNDNYQDAWCVDSMDHDQQLICNDEGREFIPREWEDEDVCMYIFVGSQYRSRQPESRHYYFILIDDDRLIIKDPTAEEWKLTTVYDPLVQFLLEDASVVKGVTYTVVFVKQSTEPVSVTKRRRLIIDIEVDVELDDPDTPHISPGRILYDAGADIIERFKQSPHILQHRVHHWNVDHMELGFPTSAPVIANEEKDADAEGYLRFNDRPGIWRCDRVNKRGDKR